MQKYKNKIIAAIILLAILAVAWLYGGRYGSSNSAQDSQVAEVLAGIEAADEEISPNADIIGENNETLLEVIADATDEESDNESEESRASEINRETITESAAAEKSEPNNPETEKPEAESTKTQTKDQYQTDPVPAGKPEPVEAEDVTVGDDSFTITLSVRCDTILDNKDLLNKEKWELVPEDAVIYFSNQVTVYEGESVFNVLQRELKREKIHLEFRMTAIYNSAYIMGINNLYEFDCGELSGWMYKVNGWFPNYGCSRYQLKPGDLVQWVYTCDLGRDVGGEEAVK